MSSKGYKINKNTYTFIVYGFIFQHVKDIKLK
jgi:hypothetical protein